MGERVDERGAAAVLEMDVRTFRRNWPQMVKELGFPMPFQLTTGNNKWRWRESWITDWLERQERDAQRRLPHSYSAPLAKSATPVKRRSKHNEALHSKLIQ